MMITFDDMLNEQMKDEEFRKEYEAIKPEMDAIRKIVDSRIYQENCGFSYFREMYSR